MLARDGRTFFVHPVGIGDSDLMEGYNKGDLQYYTAKVMLSRYEIVSGYRALSEIHGAVCSQK